MSEIKFREALVTFKPDAEKNKPTARRLYLRLEGPFVLSGGLQPNINRAVTPYTEFAKLGSSAAFRDLGTIEFWFTRKPGDYAPDHAISNVRIVDVEPLGFGRVQGGTEFIATEVRLMLADSREQIAEPRGGRLTDGLLNPPNVGADESLTPNSTLVQTCIDAITLPVENLLGTEIDDVPPPRELKWEGAHAPTELLKILERISGCICPKSGGGIGLSRIGYAHEGDVPDSEGPEIRLPGSGRRGKIAVFTSAPYPVTNTVTLEGPHPNTWDLVAREPQGLDADGQIIWRWLPVDYLLVAKGNICARLQEWGEPPSWLKGVVWTDLMHYIRLSKNAVDPKTSPVWRVVRGSSGAFSNIRVEAKIAVEREDGSYANADVFVTCSPEVVLLDHETGEPVLKVSEWLFQVDAECVNRFEHARTLIKGDLRVTVTYEEAAAGKKDYLAIGFQRRGGKIEMLTDAETLAAVGKGGPDVVVLSDPSLRIYKVNGEEKNRNALNAKAKALAELYFWGDEEDYRILTLPGFVAVEVSGVVNEVEWNQDDLTTTVKVNGWKYPEQQSRAREILQAAAAGSKTGGGSGHDSAGTYVGGIGKAEPVTVLGSSPGASSGGGASVLWATAKTTWTGGNTMWCTRRTSLLNATVPPGSQDVMLDLTMPFWVSPVEVQIGAGDPLPYILIGENEGLCLAIKQGGTGSESIGMGTTAGQVPIMINNADWAWELPFGVNIPVE